MLSLPTFYYKVKKGNEHILISILTNVRSNGTAEVHRIVVGSSVKLRLMRQEIRGKCHNLSGMNEFVW